MKILILFTGWRVKHYRASLLAGLICLLPMQSIYAEAIQQPSVDLLEFIGDGVEVENEIVDPLGVYEMQTELDIKQNKSDEQETRDEQ